MKKGLPARAALLLRNSLYWFLMVLSMVLMIRFEP